MEMEMEMLLLPFHGQGHLFPFTQLALQLAARGISVTVAVPTELTSVISSACNHPLVRVALLSLPPSPPDAPSQPPFLRARLMAVPFSDLLANRTTAGTIRPICVVIDALVGWAIEVCQKYAVPSAVFFTNGTCACALEYVGYHLPDDTNPEEPISVAGLPENLRLTFADLIAKPPSGQLMPPPSAMGVPPGVPPMTSFAPPARPKMKFPPWVPEVAPATAFLFNTCDELEKPFIDCLARESGKKAFGVGPLLPNQLLESARGTAIRDAAVRTARKESSISEEEVAAWLDSKPTRSVVFVSFGSEFMSTTDVQIWGRWFSETADDENLLRCPNNTVAVPVTCPDPHPLSRSKSFKRSSRRAPECPQYFRWIHEDLRPWKRNGITLEMVENASKFADFRLLIIAGKVYVEQYWKSFQTRDVFTMWGILQLLRWYPGTIPDLDLVFACADFPVVPVSDFGDKGLIPPPVFHYCGDNTTHDIVFPDWSFWGWPEINIEPWGSLQEELNLGNARITWEERKPTAYWKGNPSVAAIRKEILKCNVTNSSDWNARLYNQDWIQEEHDGFRKSHLADQCIHRYKIYVEGITWSVSRKYIMACNSPTLVVNARYYNFFSRSLVPNYHYWPVRADAHRCHLIKFAVDWGNIHPKEAQEMGKSGSNFVQNDLRMENVYDYMLHILTQYAKLLNYKPSVPPNAKLVCLESMVCHETGLVEKFIKNSMVNILRQQGEGPCELPTVDPTFVDSFLAKEEENMKQVQSLEQQAWDKSSKSHKQSRDDIKTSD